MDLSIPIVREELVKFVQSYRKCGDCSLSGQMHPAIRFKTTAKFMVVTDCPTFQEEKSGKLLDGDSGAFIKQAILNTEMTVGDGYYTALVKAKKDDKFLSNEQLSGCKQHIDHEVKYLKPPVIVALGSAAIKHFLPGIKGGTEALAGTATYVPELEATVVCGINPAQIVFNPSKQRVLDKVFEKVAEIVS
jgi:DNA polymerase-3 subunit alpha